MLLFDYFKYRGRNEESMHINIKSNYVHVSIISYKSNMMRVSNTNVSEQSHVIPDYTNYANLTVIKTRITFTLIHVYYLQ